jgi:hypothetical protein
LISRRTILSKEAILALLGALQEPGKKRLAEN